MNEILSGMRVIKMYCWEQPFAQLVSKERKLEKKNIIFEIIFFSNEANNQL